MRGASSLLYSIPRRGRLTNEVPTLSKRSTSCIGSGSLEIRSEPSSLSLRSVLNTTSGSENGCHHASANPLTPPLLLLEGDEFFLSSSGIARTYYEIAVTDKQAKLSSSPPFGLEEHYDLKGARKTFALRQTVSGVARNVGTQARRSVGIKLMGPSLARLDVKEIDHGVVGTAGTGAMTWEASITMSIFWTLHADLLLGDVIELGSGVGLGGILSGLIGATSFDSKMTSMTLTDHNDEVLDQCRENVLNAQQATTGQLHLKTPCNIDHLDWYDFLNDSGNCAHHRNHYDTVIASDCAYRYHDLVALARTMKGLLKPNSSSRIHFFGPHNRGALLDLIGLLENESLDLAMEDIDLKRYRLKPQHGQNKPLHVQNTQNVDMAAIASQTTSKYLHVAASHKVADPANCDTSMAEID